MENRVKEFHQGRYIGLKNSKNEILVPAIYEDFQLLSHMEYKVGDLISAKEHGKFGLLKIGSEKKWIIKPRYDHIGVIENGFLSVNLADKWGIYDLEKDQFIVPLDCEQVESVHGFLFINGIGIFSKKGKYGIIDIEGNCSKAVFDDVDIKIGSLVTVKFKGEWGFLDKETKFTQDEEQAYISCWLP